MNNNLQSLLENTVHPPRPGLYRMERLIFLIDGVFAITLTLLVLDLRPPEVADPQFAEGLHDLLPRLIIYFLAFFTIANQWVAHFQSFRLVRYIDLPLLWLNLLNLLFVTLLPASTALVGHYPLEPLAAMCFSLNGMLMCLSATIIWAYVYRRAKIFAPESTPQVLRGVMLIWLINSAGMLLALVLGFISTVVAAAIWFAWPWLVQAWWYRYRRSRPNRVVSERT
jgi:uncharacterized membrane protein